MATTQQPWPRIKVSTDPRGVEFYRVDLRKVGQGQRYFPKTADGYKRATDLAQSVRDRESRFGEFAWELSVEQLADAVKAHKLIEESAHALKLSDIVRKYLKKLPKNEDLTIREAIRNYQAYKATQENLRHATQDEIYKKTNQFGNYIYEKYKCLYPRMHKVSVEDVESFLNTYKENSKRSYYTILYGFFKFCVARTYCFENPLDSIKKPPKVYRDIKILKPTEAPKILHELSKVAEATTLTFALMCYAGLRKAEALLVRYDDIKEGYIHVRSEVSKIRRERYVPIEPVLQLILEQIDFPHDGLLFSDHQFKRACKKVGVTYPRNAARKSYITYHMIKYNDAGKTAMNSGHTINTSIAHYKSIATPEQAATYFSTEWLGG